MKGPSPLELPSTISPIKPTSTITMGIIHHIFSFQSSWANSRNVSMIPFIARCTYTSRSVVLSNYGNPGLTLVASFFHASSSHESDQHGEQSKPRAERNKESETGPGPKSVGSFRKKSPTDEIGENPEKNSIEDSHRHQPSNGNSQLASAVEHTQETEQNPGEPGGCPVDLNSGGWNHSGEDDSTDSQTCNQTAPRT